MRAVSVVVSSLKRRERGEETEGEAAAAEEAAAAAAVAAAEASLGSLLSARPIRLPPPRAHVVIEVVEARDPSSVVASVSSAEDEVNAAAFHPHAGGGIAYGTKEGRLRLLRTGWG